MKKLEPGRPRSGSSVATALFVGANCLLTALPASASQSGITFQAQSAAQWLDVTGSSSNSTLNGVTQTVATAVGQAYELDSYIGSATDSRSTTAAHPATTPAGSTTCL